MARSAGAMRASRAYVEFFGDDSRLVADLRRVETRLRKFGGRFQEIGRRMMMVGGLGLAGLGMTVKTFASLGDQIAKMGRRTGFSVEALSELRFAATRSGTSVEALETSLRRMQRTVYDSTRGLSTQVDGLRDLGLSVEEIVALTPEQQFMRFADALSQVEDATKRSALAQVIFGRAGTQMIPLIEQGAAGINELRQEARRLGLTIRTDAARAAEVLTDRLGDVWAVVKRVSFEVGAVFAPVVTRVADRLREFGARAVTWVRRNAELLKVVAKVGVEFVGVGAALFAFGKIAAGLGLIVGGLRATLMTLGAALTFASSSAGLAVTALAGLGAAIVVLSGRGKVLARVFSAAFQSLARDVKIALGGIGDAIRAGDLRLAMRVAAAKLRLEWTRLTNFLSLKWTEFGQFFERATVILVYGARAAWNELAASFSKAMSGVTGIIELNMASIAERITGLGIRLRGWLGGSDVTDELRELRRVYDREYRGIVNTVRNRLGEIEAERRKKFAELQRGWTAETRGIEEAHNRVVESQRANIASLLDELKRRRGEAADKLKKTLERMSSSADKFKRETQRATAEFEQATGNRVRGETTVTFAGGALASMIAGVNAGESRVAQKIGEQKPILQSIDGGIKRLNINLEGIGAA